MPCYLYTAPTLHKQYEIDIEVGELNGLELRTDALKVRAITDL